MKKHNSEGAESKLPSGGASVDDRRRQLAMALGLPADSTWEKCIERAHSLAVDDELSRDEVGLIRW